MRTYQKSRHLLLPAVLLKNKMFKLIAEQLHDGIRAVCILFA